MTDPPAAWPIQANLGGPVDPADHIGHGDEFGEVLRSVGGVGALVTGDRRMGKTSLLRKVEHVLSPEHVVLRISAETDDPELFGRRLVDVLRGHRVFAEELARWNVTVDVGWRGVRIRREGGGGEQGPDGADDLFRWAAGRAAPTRLVVILDEIAVLAMAIERRRPGGAVEFLRSLRRPRQEAPNLAMVLAGSVGLHHAVVDTTPVNDLQRVRVGPLVAADAAFLARCLLLGEQVATSDEEAVVAAMVEAADAIPYFLHHLAHAAHRRGAATLRPDDVWAIRDEALVDPDDPWNLRHYRDRLRAYYGADADLAGHVLDAVAVADAPLDLSQLGSRLGAVDLDVRPSRDALLALVERLEADHYLARRGAADTFATRIVRDAWRAMRRL
ncbi:MAG: ATP-binding protein [Acidimicrobiia bacterium]